MKTINYDREEFRVGNSIYGEEYQITINEEKINQPDYLKLVQTALKLLKKKTTKHRKENTIVFQPRKEKILAINHINKEPAHEPYNKWLVKIIKQNEKERKELANIATMLGV